MGMKQDTKQHQSSEEVGTNTSAEHSPKIERRKNSERELENRLKRAMEAGKIFSWEMNPATRKLEWSSNMETVIGFPLLDNIDKTFKLIHPDDVKSTLDAINKAIETGGEYESEYRLVNPANGEEFWFQSQGAITSDTADGLPRFVGITQNITERKRAEIKLKDAALRLEQQTRIFDTALSTINDFTYIFDKDGRFVYSNQPLLD
jgi:PAS domain S-box-containing protein